MKCLSVLLVVLSASAVSADPLTDVRATLGHLTAREPIHATYELQRTVASAGSFGDDHFSGKAVVELEGDASGFRVIYPRPLLDQIEREQQARNRDAKETTPTVKALSEVDPVETRNAIDFAPELLRMLDGAQLVSDAASTFQGKPARAIVLKLASHLDPDDAGKVKIAENRLTLWLGQDLVPVGAEHIVNAKFSFLVFHGESKKKRSWYFAHVADRLVRVRHESSESNSGMGQKGNESLVATVRVH
jgi:hypothetical protein